jgi:hypothetical protein
VLDPYRSHVTHLTHFARDCSTNTAPPRYGRRMVQETWTSRDLPVLEAIAELYDEGQSDRVDVTAVGHRTGLDKEAVQHAIRNLKNAGYITGATRVGAGAKYGFVGALAPEGLRVVGACRRAGTRISGREPSRRGAKQASTGGDLVWRVRVASRHWRPRRCRRRHAGWFVGHCSTWIMWLSSIPDDEIGWPIITNHPRRSGATTRAGSRRR